MGIVFPTRLHEVSVFCVMHGFYSNENRAGLRQLRTPQEGRIAKFCPSAVIVAFRVPEQSEAERRHE